MSAFSCAPTLFFHVFEQRRHRDGRMTLLRMRRIYNNYFQHKSPKKRDLETYSSMCMEERQGQYRPDDKPQAPSRLASDRTACHTASATHLPIQISREGHPRGALACDSTDKGSICRKFKPPSHWMAKTTVKSSDAHAFYRRHTARRTCFRDRPLPE